MSKRAYPRINWHRWCWLCLRHHERTAIYYARLGKFTLSSLADEGVAIYRKYLGIES